MHPEARKNGLSAYYHSLAAQHGHKIDARLVRAPAISARINHGRWIADCPDCAGAEYVDESEPIFFCMSCGNLAVGGHFRRVKFPKDKAKIEGCLNGRPVANRNWAEGETVADLEAENALHNAGGVN